MDLKKLNNHHIIGIDIAKSNTFSQTIRIQLQNTCIEEMQELWKVGDEYPIPKGCLKRLGIKEDDKLIILNMLKNDGNSVWVDLLVK